MRCKWVDRCRDDSTGWEVPHERHEPNARRLTYIYIYLIYIFNIYIYIYIYTYFIYIIMFIHVYIYIDMNLISLTFISQISNHLSILRLRPSSTTKSCPIKTRAGHLGKYVFVAFDPNDRTFDAVWVVCMFCMICMFAICILIVLINWNTSRRVLKNINVTHSIRHAKSY